MFQPHPSTFSLSTVCCFANEHIKHGQRKTSHLHNLFTKQLTVCTNMIKVTDSNFIFQQGSTPAHGTCNTV